MAFARSLVLYPFAFIYSSVLPGECTGSFLPSVFELADVFISVGVNIDSFSGTFSVCVVTFIAFAVLKIVNTFSMLYIFYPISDIFIAIGVIKCSAWKRYLLFSKRRTL
jgi:hypothetical protein